MIGMRLAKLLMQTRNVTEATARAGLRVLSKIGAFVMTRARQSIKRAPKKRVQAGLKRVRKKLKEAFVSEDQVAPPGHPPYSHRGGPLKRFIRFAVERETLTVVIGPEKLGGKVGDAPQALEKGGPSQAMRGARRQLQDTNVREHPYMIPARNKELPKFAGMLKDQVRP